MPFIGGAEPLRGWRRQSAWRDIADMGSLFGLPGVGAGRGHAAVAGELAPLKLDAARFQTSVEKLPEDRWTAAGMDAVEFQIATNPGAPFAPLNKIASGGELSRFLLALKVALADRGSAPTLVFDEIDTGVGEVAKREGVEIKLYAIIYELIDEVKEAMAGLLDPLLKDVVTGQAEVRRIFDLSKGGNVAGCAVTSGKIVRGKMRVIRKGDLVYEGISHTLKRFKDEVNEVSSGMECGIRLDGFDDFKEGDIVECYMQEKVAQKL